LTAENCSVLGCVQKNEDGDRLFCKEHRIIWQRLVTPYGLIDEETLYSLLKNFQMNSLKKYP